MDRELMHKVVDAFYDGKIVKIENRRYRRDGLFVREFRESEGRWVVLEDHSSIGMGFLMFVSDSKVSITADYDLDLPQAIEALFSGKKIICERMESKGMKPLSGNAVIMAREDHIDDVNDGSAHCITKDDRWRVVG